MIGYFYCRWITLTSDWSTELQVKFCFQSTATKFCFLIDIKLSLNQSEGKTLSVSCKQ